MPQGGGMPTRIMSREGMKYSSYFKDITLSVERRNSRKFIAGVVDRPDLEATAVNSSER